jgi:hypothetical protein
MRPAALIATLTLLAPALAEEPPVAAEAGLPPAAVPVEPPAPAAPMGPGTSISRSEQFRVSGDDFALRGSVALIAEEAKSALLRLTEEPKDEWKIPITVQLRGTPGDAPPSRSSALKIFLDDTHYQIHIDVHIGRGIHRAALMQTVTAALIHERALHEKHPADTPFNVPPWLVEGLLEATAWRLGNGDRKLYQTLVSSGGLFTPDDLFEVDPRSHLYLDAAMRAAFRASSGALVMALLEQPQGLDGMRAFLKEIAPFQGEIPLLLRRHFPELNLSANSLAKWLALQLAAKAAAPVTDVLTVEETDSAITDALVVHLRDPEGLFVRTSAATAWGVFPDLDPAARSDALQPPKDALTRLSNRCFPSHRPLIADYLTIIHQLESGNIEQIEARFTDLASTRSTMLEMAGRARDYLDWFEITRARETSGAFDDYLNLKERLKHPPYQRKDTLSEYLERMDKLFHREVTPSVRLSQKSQNVE